MARAKPQSIGVPPQHPNTLQFAGRCAKALRHLAGGSGAIGVR